ncbi:MAG: L,D-transpeptidase family protein [Pseudomonadota bacterium]
MKRKTISMSIVTLFLSCFFYVVFGLAYDPDLIGQLQEKLRNRIESAGVPPALMVGEERIHASTMLLKFYENKVYVPAWFDNNGPVNNIDELIKSIQDAAKEGLEPSDYHIANITRMLEDIKKNQKNPKPFFYSRLVDLELLLTDAYLLLGSHYLAGRVNPQTIDSEWFAYRHEIDLSEVLQNAFQYNNIKDSLQSFLPSQSGYKSLRDALAFYRNILEKGGWQTIPEGQSLKKGDKSERIVALRKRLSMTNDLKADQSPESDYFDNELEEAVKLFQKRHGMDIDGAIGKMTLSALNKSVNERIEQIEVNMERWRWLPNNLGKRYIIVNIANFELDVLEDNKEVMTMHAIVGKTYRRTPVFSGLMRYLVLNPYWQIPPGIAVKDILTDVKKDIGYLAKKNIKVFQGWGENIKEIDPATIDWSKITGKNLSYRFRQEPGPDNSLGDIKFMFPNQFDVYIHDTPSKELFQKTERGFSSGCIRIQKPIELAEYVLKNDPNWTRDKIITSINKRMEQTVRLPEPIPVHILYWTAWANEDGQINFRNDIYKRDQPLLKALKEAPPAN